MSFFIASILSTLILHKKTKAALGLGDFAFC